MNDTTRTTLENLALERLRQMDRTLLQIRRVNRELETLRNQQRESLKAIEGYLDTIAQSDPFFNKEAWLNYAKRELI